ncbi:hypothetical protein CDD81_8135 [Ophiocordyceps australis]|uniref:Uncharacterized protein n=1 Tax=Ophiocordyceps australis TaxID=1399860 RepID=A0A2C5Y2H9_9HYPO|nr:hypothetical protein CDD81_8135 [Ophiocordyceps australis]
MSRDKNSPRPDLHEEKQPLRFNVAASNQTPGSRYRVTVAPLHPVPATRATSESHAHNPAPTETQVPASTGTRCCRNWPSPPQMLLQTSLRGPVASSDAKQKVCPSAAVDSFHGCSNCLCGVAWRARCLWARPMLCRLPKWANAAVKQRLRTEAQGKDTVKSGDNKGRAASSICRRGITSVVIMHSGYRVEHTG